MLRRRFMAALLSLLCVGKPGAQARAQTSANLETAAATTLRKTLEAGLKARRPQEFAFIATVAEKVEDGTLPRSLVESTFFWARRKGPVPFVHFESAIRLRAKRIGVVL